MLLKYIIQQELQKSQMEVFICIKLLLITDVFWRCKGQSIFLKPQEGKAFLNREKRDINNCLTYEYCEENMNYCRENWESAREDNCKTSLPCPGTSMCHLNFPCISPWHNITTQCKNVNDCLSYPCLNDGVCIDTFDGYNCSCLGRFEGKNCGKDCRPGPADIVFVVDTSASVLNENNRSIEFIDEFIRKVPIGLDDFQIGVITFNFVSEVLFDLNDYTSESDMLLDLLTIKPQDAATFTAPALQKAVEMLKSYSMGARSDVAKYIILLYDGLASDINDAVTTAASIIAMNIRILTVGFGKSISHQEMMMLSRRQYDTFSLTHIDDILNRMYKESADTECADCSLNTGTDLLILLDTSKHQTTDGYNDRLITTRKIIESILSYNPTARIGMMSYSEEPELVFSLSWSNDKDKLIAASLQVKKESLNSEANTSHALEHIRKNNSFSSKRKIILLLSDGNWNDKAEIKHEIYLLDKEGVEVTGALAGHDCVIDNYSNVVKDPSLLYYVEVDDDDWTALESLASTTTYYECIDDIFTKRQ